MENKGNYIILREETYEDGQVIFEEDGANDSLYIIINGEVETSKNVRNQRFVIERIKEGELFGETSLVGDLRQAVTARAVGKTTLGIVKMDPLRKEYEQLSKQFRSIVESIPVRLKKIIDRASDFSD
jgi:CRP-like cAMP-binding protein